MRVKIQDFESKKELFKYLKANKETLIAQKKSMPIYSDPCNIHATQVKSGGIVKNNGAVEGNPDVLRVKVVANTSNFIDSHLDMLLPDAAKKSIVERKAFIPHLHDHVHTIDAKIGEVQDIILQDLSLTELGLNGFGTTQAIVFITDVYKSYNEKVFNQYKQGRINQHSIGLQYVKLDLAINDEDSPKEFGYWEENINKAINPEAAEQAGFFWVVSEIKLIENSAVLFGANSATPTLDNNLNDNKSFEPSKDTQEAEPSPDTQQNQKPNTNIFNFI
jgi:hypothetical protein